MKYILASKSPRRREILSHVIKDFSIEVSDIEEVFTQIKPDEIVKELATLKGMAVWNNHPEDNVCVISSDTVVAVDETILGKPANYNECFDMIRKISGRKHYVYTGVLIIARINGETISKCFAEGTEVNVKELSDEEIDNYINEGESYDKAGGYAIQGVFSKFITGINGGYHNVVGLPISHFYDVAKEMNVL